MKLIVGLGNPGGKFDGTPHNVGFEVIDELAQRWSCRLRHSFRFQARIGKCTRAGEPLLLVKPETFMNNSGSAVGKILRYWKLTPDQLTLVLDDADLLIGRLRIRPKGSSGGHRGLESVVRELGSGEFARVRLGIGRGEGSRDLVSHVLSPFSAEEQKRVSGEILRVADAVECLMDKGVEAAMNRFNASTSDEQ